MTYSLIPSDPDLVAGWDMQQRLAGVVKDASISDYDADLVGHPLQGHDRAGNYLLFDGANDYLNAGPSAGFAVSEAGYTLIAVIRTDLGGSLITRREGLTQFDWYINKSTGYLTFNWAASSYAGSTDVANGRLNFACVVLSGSASRFYLNGSAIDGTFSPAITPQLVSTRIGAWGSASNAFAGALYAAAIYDVAKSEAWIQQEYNRLKVNF